jgi:SecD/SecF fusion protein
MQNRGAIRLFAIVFAIVAIYHLSFTYFAGRVEKKAKAFAYNQSAQTKADELAKGNENMRTYYLDSIATVREYTYLDSMKNEKVYPILGFTYDYCKKRELNLGLDLKGGMNVTLEVSVPEIVRGLAHNSKNETFKKAMKRAIEMQRSTDQNFVDLFGLAINEVDPNFSLASIFLYEFKNKNITTTSTNEEVLSVIKEEVDGAFERAHKIIRTRIDRFGVTQPNIQKIASTNRILVELPGVKDPRRVRKLLQGTAKLEFWETFKLPEVINFLAAVDKAAAEKTKLAESVKAKEDEKDTTEAKASEANTVKADTTETLLGGDSLKTDEELLANDDTDSTMNQTFNANNHPLFYYLHLNLNQKNDPIPSATMGYCKIKDTARVNKILREYKELLPRDLKLSWIVKPQKEGSEVLSLFGLKAKGRDAGPALTGEYITDARKDIEQNGRVSVSMSMNSEGAKIWKRLTGEHVGDQIAILLDNYVYSAPNVNQEIPNGRSNITGGFTIEEAEDLANVLKAGKLPAPARIIEEAVVGPSLGKEAVSAGLWSFVFAFLMVLLFMFLYYSKSGLIANVALVTNIFFLFGVLASFGAVLTLPGIAGIVLTLGMAVDANVIIFERIKEELRAGKGIKLAIEDGYKFAYSAIIDGNVTTLLTAIILFIFGSGPVQGFATTLIIGILTSLFSAIFISRLIFTTLLRKGTNISFGTKATLNFLANAKYDFIKVRKIGYIISGTLAIVGVISLFTLGLNYGVDFSGGRTYTIRFDQGVKVNDIRKSLAEVFIDEDGNSVSSEVKTFGPDRQIKVTTKYMIDSNNPNIDIVIQKKLFTALKPYFADQNINENIFISDSEKSDKDIGIMSSQKVGPTIADDIKRKSGWAILFALIVIFIYIAIRFKKWQYGLSGVIALFHDALITIGIFSLFWKILPFNMEIDQAFIAAILTIIGYSINDTVIIFDRIREYIFLHKRHDLKTNINNALNNTLSRTINTSGTTLLVLITIFIFGGEIIRGFVFALTVGVIVGTYSSLFVASPIAYDMITNKDAEIQEKKKKTATKKK